MNISVLKQKKKRSLIVICTLGIAAVPLMLVWSSNIFKGTSLDNGGMSFLLAVISFILLFIPCVAIGFIYHLIRYFYLRLKEKTLTLSVVLLFFSLSTVFAQQNTVIIQQNQQNVNINLPVIEKTVYVDKYRTVYVDRPQPKRIARKLDAPIQLLGYLWVYTEDLGNFKQHPLGVIQSLNNQNPHGRNNWRIPTPDELAVLEANADKIGLGDDVYMATNYANGILRLVSTGSSVLDIARGVNINGVIWAVNNVGGSGYGKLLNFDEAQGVCPVGWRLPTKDEFQSLINSGSYWTQVDGMYGRIFGQGNNTIFLPAGGYYGFSGSSNKQGAIGNYHTSSYTLGWTSNGKGGNLYQSRRYDFLEFDDTNTEMTWASGKYNGRCVRCVRK